MSSKKTYGYCGKESMLIKKMRRVKLLVRGRPYEAIFHVDVMFMVYV